MDKELVKKLEQSSHLAAGNIAYVEALYDDYLKDQNSVDAQWRDYFKTFTQAESAPQKDSVLSEIRAHFIELGKLNGYAAQRIAEPALPKDVQIQKLIDAYRNHGHHQALIDPLNLTEPKEVPDLHLGHHGLSQADLDNEFHSGAFMEGKKATLKNIVNKLKNTYSSSIGVEYTHITDTDQTQWLQHRLESVAGQFGFSKETKVKILEKLTAAEGLEKFLGARYVGQTRFSLEGGASLIPMLDAMIDKAGEHKVKEVIMGMGHRGRLNVMVNILGKPVPDLINDFEGKSIREGYSGDVKYHSGYSSDVTAANSTVHLALAFNPSHLEIINPVVEGSVRARQERRADFTRDEVVPVLMHGDAAFAGQGVVMETFSLSQARGFSTGGTIHIVVNNQIGFTTSNPMDSRSSLYCTDVAKMVQAPIFHVNGDDPEACAFVMQLAFDFRMNFKKDVMIDFVCYRRYGHNEADEPMATQPLMYSTIKKLPRTRDIYAKQLVSEGVLSEEDVKQLTKAYRDKLDNGEEIIATIPKEKTGQTYANWKPYKDQKWDMKYDSKIDKKRLVNLAKAITTIPQDFKLQAQVAREYENREKMITGEVPLNWGFAEALAYADILDKSYSLRLSGQDCGRGTFSHRHAVLHDQNTGNLFEPLKNVSKEQGQFNVIDSVLSEEAVMGFEYGYATTDPETLVIWEAQYGDFYNGAQVVVDQFLASGEQKWARLCGLSLFLPHGYEGAGPEHSSARLERFLQACAQDNIQVAVPTTPAQIFNLIRRQILRPYRKPLIVMTPKSLLRHKLAVSSLEELSYGKYRSILDEVDEIKEDKVKRVILCCGKVYYDLLQTRRDNSQDDVAIIRLEQLYPFPCEELKELLNKFGKAKDIVWCQEEPKNQGAWYSIVHSLEDCLAKGQSLRYVGRTAAAAPATGFASVHREEQATLVSEALRK